MAENLRGGFFLTLYIMFTCSDAFSALMLLHRHLTHIFNAVFCDKYHYRWRHPCSVGISQQLLPHCRCWGSSPYKMLPHSDNVRSSLLLLIFSVVNRDHIYLFAMSAAITHLIARKIVATRCHILRLKCTKFDFG